MFDWNKNPDPPSCEILSYRKILHGELIRLNEIASDEAYVFISSGQFLTEGDITILRQNSDIISSKW
jgi:hypothetical protein